MKFNYFTTKIPFLGVFSLIFLLASCGSYEYVGYDTDGIYGSDQTRTVEVPPQQQTQVETNNDGTYYKNYFSEKAREYEYALEEGEIFTDIDSYEGDYNQEIDSLDYNKSYAGWGQNNSNVTINVIDNGWNSWGWFYPSGWNSWYYSPRYSWGWNSWGWNVGFGYPYHGYYYGYGHPYYGYGYGYPYYGYGYGYGYPYYGHGYGNYNRRSIAYSAGRRGSYLNRDITGINRANRSTSTSRFNSNSVRTRSSNQDYGNNSSTRTRSNTRSTTPRNNSTRATSPRRSSSTKASTPRRSSTPRASSSGSSSTRSSGSVSRSSSSSSRSSGSRSSGSSTSSSRRR